MAIETNKISVGVVGLNVAGCRIAACLVMAGHKVVAVASVPGNMIFAESHIVEYFLQARHANRNKVPEYYLKNLMITGDYSLLKPCQLVIECTAEDMEIKKSIYSKIELEITNDAILITNAAVSGIDALQKLAVRPERFFGLVWTEPFYASGSPKVIYGEKSNAKTGNYLADVSRLWGRETSLLKKHIGGLINNQSKYAAYREHLIFLKSRQHPR